MEILSEHPLIKVTRVNVDKAREILEVRDVKKINEAIDVIEEWMQKQEHLVEGSKYLSRYHIERFYLLSKGSIEGAKTRLDKYFRTRALTPELCANKTYMEFENIIKFINFLPLPNLCPKDGSRIMVTQIINNNLDEFTFLEYFRYCFLVGEYRQHYDYTIADKYIIDLKNANFSILKKFNPVILKKSEILCTEGHGLKIKGIHFVNAPSFIDKIVFLVKQVLKEKVASRLMVHSTHEDLHKHIDKEILPEDYGGDEISLSKLGEKWKEVLQTEEATEIINKLNKLVSDESKRQTSTFNQEHLGMPGSFRTLDLD